MGLRARDVALQTMWLRLLPPRTTPFLPRIQSKKKEVLCVVSNCWGHHHIGVFKLETSIPYSSYMISSENLSKRKCEVFL